MTKSAKKNWVGAVVLSMAAMSASRALAQGDPPRAFDAATAAVRPAGTKVRIDLIGDSTQTNNAGYGRGFCANLTAQVGCVNMAKGGASTKTFREQGLWERSLQTKPDYMLIQFGHNDLESKEHLPRQTTMPEYEANLRRYVEEARAAGIKPVLVTPLTRRFFEADGKIHSDLTAHAETMKRVAAEMKVPVIDLHQDSIAYLDGIGERAGNTMAITKKDTDGKTIFDKTHLDWKGSYAFGRIVAVDMGKAVPELARYVSPEAATLPPEGVKAMKIIEGGPVKIVLVGDSTVNAGGGWGKGFCAVMTPNVTCVNEALNGRSSKSFIDEGAWKKALDDHGDYYLIQFGHNDMKGKGPERETDPETTFAANIRRYIRDARAIGAVPVVVTSLSRRNYRDNVLVQDLKDYSSAARRVGMEENVTVIDLNAMSVKLLEAMTQAQADEFNATGHEDDRAENKKSPVDRTHLNPKGQALFGRMVADTLVRTQVELGPDIVGEPVKTKEAAEKPLS
ncbi:MAG TPA: rhamnogalacturonan acetylesterase [Edaphobacter sp.]|jgi:lysophospholipase L1-like esterase|nr:rhamnogalacturonan acetylesterase [Edaphobacter sp.]